MTSPTRERVQVALAETWRKWGGWPAVESGMVNMTGVLADAVMALYAEPTVPNAQPYSDRELLELFRMLLRQQIRDERIHNVTELHGLLSHVEAALS